MSGKKKIMVDEAAYFRLQKDAKRLRELKKELPKVIAKVSDQVEADLLRLKTDLDERQRKTEETIGALSERTRRFEAEVHERMSAQSERFDAALHETAGNLRRETRELLAEHEQAFRAELATERKRRQEDFKQLNARLAGVEERGERAAAAATQALEDAQAMHALIRDTLPHERFEPNALDRLEARMLRAGHDLREGNAEAALAQAQTVYFDLSDLRVDLEQRDREWRMYRAAAAEALIRVSALAEEERKRDAVDLDGRAIEGVELDVDHWSDGELARLREEIAAELARVQTDEEPLESEELRAIVERDAPAYEQLLADTVERAALAQVASQLRVNLADAVVDTLVGTTGYEFEDGTYAASDERDAFYARLIHSNGSEIVINVAAEERGSGRSVLRVLSYDQGFASEEDRKARADALTSALRESGMSVGNPVAEPGEPEPVDFEALKREAPRAVAEA